MFTSLFSFEFVFFSYICSFVRSCVFNKKMGPHRRNSHDDNSSNSSGCPDQSGQSGVPKFDRLNGPWPCCAPKGCLYNNGSNAEHIMITQEDLRCGETVRVICSNENCFMSPYLHAACFQVPLKPLGIGL